MEIKNRLTPESKRQLLISGISLLLCGILCAAVIITWAMRSTAWFTMSRAASGEGISLTSDDKSIKFSDNIIVKRYSHDGSYIEYNFKKDDDGYYNYKDGEFVLVDLNGDGIAEEKEPLSFMGLLPGNYLEVTLKYNSASSGVVPYTINLSDIDDSEGKFTADDREHSVLGIYKIGLVTEAGLLDETWLATYNETGDDTAVFPLVFKTGNFGEEPTDENGYVTTTFRISIDFTQYNALSGKLPNILSEKSFTIGSIRLSVL